jgi:hypothetical protein
MPALRLAAVNRSSWCPGKASLASFGKSEVARMKKAQKRSCSKAVKSAARAANMGILNEIH